MHPRRSAPTRSLHKPAQQTVLPAGAVPALLGPLALPKLKGLGGKFGERVAAELGIETVGQLAATPLPRLEAAFGEKDAQWLAALARGITGEAQAGRLSSRLPAGASVLGCLLCDLSALGWRRGAGSSTWASEASVALHCPAPQTMWWRSGACRSRCRAARHSGAATL